MGRRGWGRGVGQGGCCWGEGVPSGRGGSDVVVAPWRVAADEEDLK